ncbi:hypothetical protein JW935_09955 [candidate division KSB1 bacterium]|nr:hypothetical protein [candidate division KSB1 bacterium]
MSGPKKDKPNFTLVSFQKSLVESLREICSFRIFSNQLVEEADLKNIALDIENKVRHELRKHKSFFLENFQIGSPETFDTVMADFLDWINTNPLVLPLPVFHDIPNSKRIVATTAAGSALGALLGAVLLNLSIQAPQIGLLIGGSVGSGGLLSLVLASFRFKSLGFISRLFMSKSKSYNRQEYLNLLDSVIRLWLNNVFLLFRLLMERQSAQNLTTDDRSLAVLYADYLHKLYFASPESLPDVVAEMITRAHNLGIEGLAGEPAFLSGKDTVAEELVWNSELVKFYRTFGVIEAGDRVFVEEKPVIREGKVIKMGLVRKKRRK